jgi:hypothetical protein
MPTKASLLAASVVAVLGLTIAAGVMAFTPPSANPPTGGGAISVEANTPANSFYIKSNGNVGIGTTGPGMNLQIGSGTFPVVALPGVGIANGASAYSFFSASDNTHQWIGGIDAVNALSYGKEGMVSNHDLAIITNNQNRIYIQSGGNVGIGTTGPGSKLTVAGVIESTTGGIKFPDASVQTTAASGGGTVVAGNVGAGTFGSNLGYGNFAFYKDASTPILYIDATNARVGIGTTGPNSRLHVKAGALGEVAAFDNSNTTGSWIALKSNGTDHGYLQWNITDSGAAGGTSVILNNINTAAGSDLVLGTNGAVSQMVLQKGGNVGIGTTAPGALLDVQSGASNNVIAMFGATPAVNAAYPGYIYFSDVNTINSGYNANNSADLYLNYVGYQNSTSQFRNLHIANGKTGDIAYFQGSTGNVSIGGKLTVSTIDPLYIISGDKYATYVPSMTGQKEEITGVVQLQSNEKGVMSYEIDFSKVERGSDLWLFWQVTDFGKDWENLVALLTPNFDGKVWYEKQPSEKKLVIYGQLTTTPEVSYRLTAPRFDWRKWSNSSTDTAEGFVIPEK